jgi:uncharacterized protein
MAEQRSIEVNREMLVTRHPVSSYFVLTYAISWTGALLGVSPYLLRREMPPKLAGILMFPVMLLGPSAAGMLLTRLVDGKAGLRDLFGRMRRVSFAPGWYLALLLPPVVILAVLLGLKTFDAPVYRANQFFPGAAFGVLAGFFEEIGWTGYAYPKLRQGRELFAAAIPLGALWAGWHIPVVDYLGAATPHGAYWLPFFLAFTAVLVAMRVLIAFLYEQTNSVLLAQLMHASSTSALAVFSPPGVSAAQEVKWYATYAGTLCVILFIAGLVVRRRR